MSLAKHILKIPTIQSSIAISSPMTGYRAFLFVLLCSALLPGCDPSADSDSPKTFEMDPFGDQLVESQYFEIREDSNAVVEGEEGTLITLPKNCWVDESGNPVKGTVKVELAEAFSTDLMLASNLTTTTREGALLESDGMIYIGATSEGKPVRVNPAIQPYVQVPTPDKKSGMQLYHGTRDKEGNIVWEKEKELERFLTPVPLSDLEFLPEAFKKALKEKLPTGDFKEYSEPLADSLYYIMAGYNFRRGDEPSISEPAESESISDSTSSTTDVAEAYERIPCSVDPAAIQAIRGSQFENTLIATKEFEHRLQHFFTTCERGLLKLYVNNLDLNLYEIDSMVYSRMDEGSNMYQTFKNYAELKETRVKDSDVYAPLLKSYFKERKARFNREAKKLRKQMKEANQKALKKYERLQKKYQKLVFQREKQKMQHYGYKLTKLGWKDVNNGTVPRNWSEKSIEVILENDESLEEVSVYASTNYDRTMVRLKRSGDNTFRTLRTDGVGSYPFDHTQSIVIRAVKLQGEHSYYAEVEVTPEDHMQVSLTLDKLSESSIRNRLKKADKRRNKAQSIVYDLEQQAAMKKAEEELSTRSQNKILMWHLIQKAMPCCHNYGERMFNEFCSSCHKVDEKSIGPALRGSTERWNNQALMFEFIQNSTQFLEKYPEHEYSQNLFREYNHSVMTVHAELNDEMIISIMEWVENSEAK